MFYAIFSAITFVVPEQVFDSIVWLFSYLKYTRAIVDLDTLLSALKVLLSGSIIIYGIKLALKGWAVMPFGKHFDIRNK